MNKILMAGLLLLLATSCATQQFRMSEKSPRAIPHHQTSQPFFVYGIGQTREVSTSDVCNGDHKVSKVENTLAPIDVVINMVQSAFILVPIYSPRSTSITCK